MDQIWFYWNQVVHGSIPVDVHYILKNMRHAVISHKQAWDDSVSALLATKLAIISLEANNFILEGDSLITIIGFKKSQIWLMIGRSNLLLTRDTIHHLSRILACMWSSKSL